MKLHPITSPRRRQDGSAVLVVLALLSIMLIYSAANRQTLSMLSSELHLIEQRQIRNLQRLEPPPAVPVSQPAIRVEPESENGSN